MGLPTLCPKMDWTEPIFLKMGNFNSHFGPEPITGIESSNDQRQGRMGREATKPRVGPLKGIFGFILFFFFFAPERVYLVCVPPEAEMTHGL